MPAARAPRRNWSSTWGLFWAPVQVLASLPHHTGPSAAQANAFACAQNQVTVEVEVLVNQVALAALIAASPELALLPQDVAVEATWRGETGAAETSRNTLGIILSGLTDHINPLPPRAHTVSISSSFLSQFVPPKAKWWCVRACACGLFSHVCMRLLATHPQVELGLLTPATLTVGESMTFTATITLSEGVTEHVAIVASLPHDDQVRASWGTASSSLHLGCGNKASHLGF